MSERTLKQYVVDAFSDRVFGGSRVENDRVILAGRAALFAQAEITVPEDAAVAP